MRLSSLNMILCLIGIVCLASVSATILDLEDGEYCTALDGKKGTCQLLSKCKTIVDYKTKKPPICSFEKSGREPIICCPNVVRIPKGKPGRKSQLVCLELEGVCKLYEEKDYLGVTVGISVSHGRRKEECGTMSSSSAVGGTLVPTGAHPYMAAIGFCGDEKKSCDVKDARWACGGSLITNIFVLSAAHCAYPYGLGPAKWAKLGVLDLSSAAEGDVQNMRIVEIFVHPKYSADQVYHDIALFKLHIYILFNGYHYPVCLQVERNVELKKANFTGWGRTGYVEATSEKLLEAEIEFYNETECSRLVFNTNSTRTPLGLQPDLMICAGVPDGSRDACAGDSGGPLVTKNPFSCVKAQVGITSFGNKCGLPDSPGVYTRVSNYVPWIEEIAFKNEKIAQH